MVAGRVYDGSRYVGRTSVFFSNDLSTRTTVVRQDLTSQSAARASLIAFQQQLSRISSEVGNIGSFLSRIDLAINSVYAARENYSAAQGRIVDADVAQESATLIRSEIQRQAGAAVLAQANRQPALALQLLRK